MSNIKDIKSKLLGFRSNRLWKKFISVAYFMFCLLLILFTIFEKRQGKVTIDDFTINKIFESILCLTLITPYIFLSNTKFRDKLPLFKKHSLKSSILGMTLISLIMFTFIGIVNSMHSQEYKNDMKNHAYIKQSETEALCENDGEINYYCEYCGKEYTEKVTALGHDMQDESILENGDTIRKCIRCEKLETVKSTATVTAKPAKITTTTALTTTKVTEVPDSLYLKLSNEQFNILTGLIAKSFYTFELSGSDYAVAEDTYVMNALTQIYDYAYKNHFELDPEYKKAFSLRYNEETALPTFDELSQNFDINNGELSFNNETGEWGYTIASYPLNKDDVVEYDGKIYVDAEGYLDKGVVVYWIDNDIMQEVGEIKDIAYDTVIDETYYSYALNVEFYDDPDSSGWRDGESFLTTNKKRTGKPVYYVYSLDKNRKIQKEFIDYSGNISWKSLKDIVPESGTEVYMGKNSAKTYMFTIVEANKSTDELIVSYPSGSVEYKSYSAIVNNETLYVKN